MSDIEDAILKALSVAKPGSSIDPGDAAKILDPERWQRRFKSVRAEAVRLAKAGRLVIVRKGKPVDPDDFKGVYRLRLPDDAPRAGAGGDPEPGGEPDVEPSVEPAPDGS